MGEDPEGPPWRVKWRESVRGHHHGPPYAPPDPHRCPSHQERNTDYYHGPPFQSVTKGGIPITIRNTHPRGPQLMRGGSTIIMGHQKIQAERMQRGQREKEKGNIGRGIFNLSRATFTEDEMRVLDLLLKYAPPKNMNKFEVYIDLQKFVRKFNIKKAFF